MKTIIKVTQEDIDMGHKRSAIECPVALALRREVGNLRCVGNSYIELNNRKYSTPEIVQNFIFQFDHNYIAMDPFEFELDI